MIGLFVIILAAFGCVNGADICDGKSNDWVSLPSMPKPTGECGSVTMINDKLYVAGEANEDTFVYDFNTNKWDTVAFRLYPGNHQSSQVINGIWYLIGGIDEHSYGKIQTYDPNTNKWTEKASMPNGYDGGSVQTVYWNNTDSIYACGGIIGFNNGTNKGGTGTTDQCARYAVGEDKWYQDIPKMPQGINHGATSLKVDTNEMWIFGGRGGKNVPSDGYNIVQVLNLETKTWKTSNNDNNIKPMPVGRGGTGVSIYSNNKFYIFGGETKDNPGGYATNNLVYNRTDIYDVSSNTWISGAVMPVPRHGIYPVLKDNAIYIAAGGVHNGWSYNGTFDAYCI